MKWINRKTIYTFRIGTIRIKIERHVWEDKPDLLVNNPRQFGKNTTLKNLRDGYKKGRGK